MQFPCSCCVPSSGCCCSVQFCFSLCSIRPIAFVLVCFLQISHFLCIWTLSLVCFWGHPPLQCCFGDMMLCTFTVLSLSEIKAVRSNKGAVVQLLVDAFSVRIHFLSLHIVLLHHYIENMLLVSILHPSSSRRQIVCFQILRWGNTGIMHYVSFYLTIVRLFIFIFVGLAFIVKQLLPPSCQSCSLAPKGSLKEHMSLREMLSDFKSNV